jgi:HEPN domain-containing protein
MQRHVAAEFAIKEYKRRLKGMPDGHRRDELLGMITDISRGNYAERPIPAHDYEKEAIIHG